jgi:hypothetical protein
MCTIPCFACITQHANITGENNPPMPELSLASINLDIAQTKFDRILLGNCPRTVGSALRSLHLMCSASPHLLGALTVRGRIAERGLARFFSIGRLRAPEISGVKPEAMAHKPHSANLQQNAKGTV